MSSKLIVIVNEELLLFSHYTVTTAFEDTAWRPQGVRVVRVCPNHISYRFGHFGPTETDITVLSFRLANRSDSYKKGDIFRHRQYVCVCLCVCVCVCIRQCEDTGFSEFLAVLWNIGQYIIIYKLAYLYIFM